MHLILLSAFALVPVFSVWAAPAPLFLESARWQEAANRNAASEIFDWAQEVGADPDRYLSLGETHLFPEANRPLLQRLAEKYFQSSQTPIHSCYESLGQDFRDSPFGSLIWGLSQTTLELTGNSPTRTDFRACSARSKKWFTYSGAFHQWPLPLLFPRDFWVTPVATQPGNTISTQLPKGRGAFLAELDALYLENQATVAVLAENQTNVTVFRNRVASLVAAQNQLRRGTQDLSDISYSPVRIAGVLLDASSLGIPVDSAIMPAGAKLLVTELKIREELGLGLLLLKALAALPDLDLHKYLSAVAAARVKHTYSSLLQFLKAGQDELSPLIYGPLNIQFPPGSEYWQLSAVDPMREPFKSAIVVAQPRTGASPFLRCFATTDSNLPYKEVLCSNLWLAGRFAP